jgi:CheY-like chemotaxis protein
VVATHDFSHIVRDMTDLLRASVPKKVALKLAPAPDLPGVVADRGQLEQIILNLVINGAEAIGADRCGTLLIGVGACEVSETDAFADEISGRPLAPGSYVWLEVADTGVGMDEGTRRKMFDPFFTTKFLGRGLGLAAVGGIVQRHHGAIQLRTAPGKGTTFRVYLPASAMPEVRRGEPGRTDLRGTATVLLADDEGMIRDFGRAALERLGYRVITASDGMEALRMFERNAKEIGLVLLDLTMPVMGGDEVISALRRNCAGLRVIVMSGYGESDVLKAFAGKGVSGFLQKPFTTTRLAEEVRAVLASPANTGT